MLRDRARQRAQEVADDADLREIAPSALFSVGGQRIETIPGERSQRQQDRRLPWWAQEVQHLGSVEPARVRRRFSGTTPLLMSGCSSSAAICSSMRIRYSVLLLP